MSPTDNVTQPHPQYVSGSGSLPLFLDGLHLINSIINLLTLVVAGISLFEKKISLDRAKGQSRFAVPSSMIFSPLFKLVNLELISGKWFPSNLDRWTFGATWIVSKYYIVVVDLDSIKRNFLLVSILLGNQWWQ